jgi:hypothetical protein
MAKGRRTPRSLLQPGVCQLSQKFRVCFRIKTACSSSGGPRADHTRAYRYFAGNSPQRSPRVQSRSQRHALGKAEDEEGQVKGHQIMRWVRRIPEGLLILLALPAYQLWHIAKYANTRQGRAAKVGAFITFLPVICICTVMWGFLWVMILWQLWISIRQ